MVSQRLRINLSDIIVKITRMAASMNGTSAKLREGDHLKMIDLLYGLMLPSGNDAAFALAEALGCLLFYEINDTIKLDEVLITKNINVSNEFPDSNEPLRYFLHEMNKTAKELKLYNTTYANPHGLMNRFNKSTASDVAKLSCVTLQNSLFLQIVNTKFYECSIKNYRIASIRKESWFNTNKLLDSGFYGVKTGITDAAGPCLVTSLKIIKKNHKDVWVVCVILNCRTMDKRWGECEELLNWGIKEILWKNEDVGINLKKNN